jgi:hypothetical protein
VSDGVTANPPGPFIDPPAIVAGLVRAPVAVLRFNADTLPSAKLVT